MYLVMEENKYQHFYDYLVKMLSIAKIGLTYSKDPYALENYQEINDITMKMIEDFLNINFDRPNYFQRDIYPTPNISVRTIIKNDKGEILFVREAKDNCYSLPGGWCDLYDTPSEAAKKEVSQEAGLEVTITRLVGVLNKMSFKETNISVPEYVLVFEGEAKGDFHNHCHETNDVRFFREDELPELSRKVSKEYVLRMLEASRNKQTIFD